MVCGTSETFGSQTVFSLNVTGLTAGSVLLGCQEYPLPLMGIVSENNPTPTIGNFGACQSDPRPVNTSIFTSPITITLPILGSLITFTSLTGFFPVAACFGCYLVDLTLNLQFSGFATGDCIGIGLARRIATGDIFEPYPGFAPTVITIDNTSCFHNINISGIICLDDVNYRIIPFFVFPENFPFNSGTMQIRTGSYTINFIRMGDCPPT